jgi:mannose-6-phosphate isomerase-like protein (cupin superfamily)
MDTLKPAVVKEVETPWESRTDPELRAKSPTRWRLLVGAERTPSKGLTVGVAEIPPGGSLILHHHAPEEVYYFLEGEGRTRIDDLETPVGPGTALFIPPNARHRTTNTGAVPLRFVWIFPTDTFREIEYHFDE